MRIGYLLGNTQYGMFEKGSVVVDIPSGVNAVVTLVALYSGKVDVKVRKGGKLAFSIISESQEKKHDILFHADVGESARCITTLNFRGRTSHTSVIARFKTETLSTVALNSIFSHNGHLASTFSFNVGDKSKICSNTLVRPTFGRTTTDHNISVKHRGCNSRSRIDVAGILSSQSACNFTGEIHIPRNAKDVKGSMNGKFMAMEESCVKALPILKIHSREAQVSHGISVMNVSEQEINYACSRGVSPADATKLVEEGIVLEMLNKMASTIDNVVRTGRCFDDRL